MQDPGDFDVLKEGRLSERPVRFATAGSGLETVEGSRVDQGCAKASRRSIR